MTWLLTRTKKNTAPGRSTCRLNVPCGSTLPLECTSTTPAGKAFEWTPVSVRGWGLRGCRTGSDRLAELPGTLFVVTSRQRSSRHTEKDKPAGAERKTWRERAYNHLARVLHAVAVAHSLHSGAPNNESSPARCCTVSVSQCESCSSDYFDGALRAIQHYSIDVPSCIEGQRGKGEEFCL